MRKYEHGRNRGNLSYLFDLACVLEVEIFFEEMEAGGADKSSRQLTGVPASNLVASAAKPDPLAKRETLEQVPCGAMPAADQRLKETMTVDDKDQAAQLHASADELLERMLATAARRFGAERAEALRPAIAELAASAAQVRSYRLGLGDRPGFYLNAKV